MIPEPTAASQSFHSTSSTQPASLSERIVSLDVLRGIAVLAALFVSVWIFGGFTDNQKNLLLLQSKGWNYRAYGLMELLFDGKMRGLIALVFGASMVLFLTKEAPPGRQPAADVFIKRQLLLIILGLLNAIVFLWTHDILFHLGVMGILLFPLVRFSQKALLIGFLLLTCVYCAKLYWNHADDKKAYSRYLSVTALEAKYKKQDSISKAKGVAVKKDSINAVQKQWKNTWVGRAASMKPDLKKDQGIIQEMRSGSYGKIWNQLLPQSQARESQWIYTLGIWDLGAMILLGMLLYKLQFFNNRLSGKQYLLIAFGCISAGFLLGWFRLYFNQVALHDYVKYINKYFLPYTVLQPFEQAFLVTGYASLLMAFINSGFLSQVWKGLQAVGKLSLTNYIMQTLACTIFFYGYGMGYFGRLSQFELYFFVVEVIIVQLAFSILWLRVYNYGPLEWLLRRLSYGKWMNRRLTKPTMVDANIPLLS
ncbi:MAG: DUF418 domain-containing protein [Candidatus Dadabacteria bacterium]